MICFNAIAVLFMCEVDNICYNVGLGERVRARVEEAGRVELTDKEATSLMRSKVFHASVIMLMIVFQVWVAGNALTYTKAASQASALLLPRLVFWIGAVFEAAELKQGAPQTLRRVGEATGAMILGFIAFLILFISTGVA